MDHSTHKALGDSSGRNCSGSSSESPLEEEVGPASIVGIVRCADCRVPNVKTRGASEGVFVLGKAEEGISNEGVGVRSFSICESKPKRKEPWIESELVSKEKRKSSRAACIADMYCRLCQIARTRADEVRTHPTT